MAKDKKPAAEATAATPDRSSRRWMRPNKRAAGYAKERKDKRHNFGAKKGEELDDYNLGLRSGYLLSMSDHAGAYIYDAAVAAGKTTDEAFAESQTIGQHRKKNNGGNK